MVPVTKSKNATLPRTLVLSVGMIVATPKPRPLGSAATLLTDNVAAAPKIASNSAETA